MTIKYKPVLEDVHKMDYPCVSFGSSVFVFNSIDDAFKAYKAFASAIGIRAGKEVRLKDHSGYVYDVIRPAQKDLSMDSRLCITENELEIFVSFIPFVKCDEPGCWYSEERLNEDGSLPEGWSVLSKGEEIGIDVIHYCEKHSSK